MTTLDDLARVEREYRERHGKDNVTANSVFALKLADTIAAYVTAQRERDVVNGWQPIETALQAPRHMQRVLYWFAPGRSWHVGEYEEPGTFGGRSGFCDTHDAPYWMPLPEPPKEPTP